jgi:hypothetical protein
MQTVAPASQPTVERRNKNNPTTAEIEAKLGRNAAEYLNEQLINSEDARAALTEEYKKLHNSYQALVQWAQLQKEKEPHLEQLLQSGLQSQAILQDPNLLANYHDRYFREVVDVPQRDIERYRAILTEDELLRTWVAHYYTNLYPELLQGMANGTVPQTVVDFNQAIDWNQSFITAVNPDGRPLDYGQVHRLKMALVKAKTDGQIPETLYTIRMGELERYGDPAYESMRKVAIQKMQQQVQQPQYQNQQIQYQQPQQIDQNQPLQEQQLRPSFPSIPQNGMTNPMQSNGDVPVYLRYAAMGGR